MKGPAARTANQDEALDLVRLRLRATLFSGLGTGWGAAPPASYRGHACTGTLTATRAEAPARGDRDLGAVLASGRIAVTGRPHRRSWAGAVIQALNGWFGRTALPGQTRAPAGRAVSAPGPGLAGHPDQSLARVKSRAGTACRPAPDRGARRK